MQLKMGGKFHLKLNIGERPIANKLIRSNVIYLAVAEVELVMRWIS